MATSFITMDKSDDMAMDIYDLRFINLEAPFVGDFRLREVVLLATNYVLLSSWSSILLILIPSFSRKFITQPSISLYNTSSGEMI
jgi:hypothetical protein